MKDKLEYCETVKRYVSKVCRKIMQETQTEIEKVIKLEETFGVDFVESNKKNN